MTQRALISVYDKSQVEMFAYALHELGWQLIASGGTARAIEAAGVPVTTVEQFTRSPEILGGRVKTLHPAIHGGILARDTDQDLQELALVHPAPMHSGGGSGQRSEPVEGWGLIEMVVSNLYPFEQVVARDRVSEADAIEQIDIGGVALTRAAAKNFERVTIVCDPYDYDTIIAELRANGATTRETRKRLAQKAFAITARYDAAIAQYLDGSAQTADGDFALAHRTPSTVRLRYGENPHQQAEWIPFNAGDPPLGGTLLQGKELSYNNLLDLDAAWRAVLSFDEPTVVIVKHLSPCGIASAVNVADAFAAALASDPISAFGGVIAANGAIDGDTVRAFGDLFVECIAAPQFTDDARARLAKRKNCRVLEILTADGRPQTAEVSQPSALFRLPSHEWRSVQGGMLRQTIDRGDPLGTPWRVVTRRAPSDDEMRALQFAWKACQHVKSNAIVLARPSTGLRTGGTATVGIGGGQPNRVDSARIAVERAGERARGAVLASDAFMPFKDTIEIAAQAGVSAIVQPGGSLRDQESIDAANAADIAMLFTGVRHFRH